MIFDSYLILLLFIILIFLIEIRSLRIRILNKYTYYINLLGRETVSIALKSTYYNIETTSRAIKKLSNKAATIDFIIDQIINAYKCDGTQDDESTLKATLTLDDIYIIPAIFESREKTLKDRSLLNQAQRNLAQKALTRDYNPYFEYYI